MEPLWDRKLWGQTGSDMYPGNTRCFPTLSDA